MNTISMSGQVATDGRMSFSSFQATQGRRVELPKSVLPNSAAEVLDNIEASKESLEASVEQLQRLSDLVTGNKLRFAVNDEIGRVVVTVLDASTNEVIREIPSEDLQRIQARMKRAIGILFDEMI